MQESCVESCSVSRIGREVSSRRSSFLAAIEKNRDVLSQEKETLKELVREEEKNKEKTRVKKRKSESYETSVKTCTTCGVDMNIDASHIDWEDVRGFKSDPCDDCCCGACGGRKRFPG